MAFIAFEGLDGAGKSTLIGKLEEHLNSAGQELHITREPGGTPLGEDLRKFLLRTDGEAPVERCELLLYQAIRAQHVEKVIRPSLAQNKWVLCDRYFASSFAFQAGGRGLSAENVSWLNQYAVDGVVPDLWVLLDLTIEESEERMLKRAKDGQSKDRFEQEAKEFHQKVRQSYLELAKAEPEQWLVLSASQSPDELFAELLKGLKQRGLLN